MRALGLPLLRLEELGIDQDDPWVKEGPVGPACAIIAGSWFLTREVELATTRAALVALCTSDDGEPVVRWSLPASKTDVEARGVSRAHGCCCSSASLASCPFHAVAAQLGRLQRLFPERWSAGRPDPDLPLFPTRSGAVVQKEKMADTFRQAAVRLGVPLASADGSERVSGHSLRVTGAQGLARAGVDTWAIQLLGRWGSSAVLGYIREVPLEVSTSWAARAARAQSLDQLIAARASASSSSSSSWSSPAALASPLASVPKAAGPPEALEEALAEAVLASTVEALPLSACSYLSSPSGKWHRLSHRGLSGASSGWSAACGWMFAGSLASLADELPTGLCHKWFCARCFPEHRAFLKDGA